MKTPSSIGKVAHDIGLSTWFGGMFFGQLSLNPTVSSISEESERGRALNEAWARFQAANLPAMLSTLLGGRLGGVREDSELRAPGLRRAKDVLLGGGATQVRSGTRPSRKTSPEAALAMRLLRFTGDGSLVLLAATMAVSALIEAAEPKPRGLFSRLFSD